MAYPTGTVLVKAEAKPPKPKPIEKYNQSKTLVCFEFIEEQERSPLYNLIYPKEMLIKK